MNNKNLKKFANGKELVAEVNQLDTSVWQKINDGIWRIMLVSIGGTNNIDLAMCGQLLPTLYLRKCPAISKLLSSLEILVSRVYLIKLAAKTNNVIAARRGYHWFRRRALYIPIVGKINIEIDDSGHTVDMKNTTIINNNCAHNITNNGSDDVIYLVVEEKTSYHKNPFSSFIECDSFEVLTPSEIADLILCVKTTCEGNIVEEKIDKFLTDWKQVFAKFGHHNRGELAYSDLVQQFRKLIKEIRPQKRKQAEVKKNIHIITSMLDTSEKPLPMRLNRQQLQLSKNKGITALRNNCPQFERPIFIVSSPRSGSTLLFQLLKSIAGIYTIGKESHEVIEGIPELHPAAKQFSSNCLEASDATASVSNKLRIAFWQHLRDHNGIKCHQQQATLSKVRFLEKTPKNALRIPFLKTVFPDALFLFLYRDPHENISSLMEGWRSHRFIAYKPLPRWPYNNWSFLLPRGWESLTESSISEISTYQWHAANKEITNSLKQLPRSCWHILHYNDLVANPYTTIGKITQFIGVSPPASYFDKMLQPLPITTTTLSLPTKDKWRKHYHEIMPLLPRLQNTVSEINTLFTEQNRL